MLQNPTVSATACSPLPRSAAIGALLAAVPLGGLFGTALQLQQPALWSGYGYGGAAALAAVLAWLARAAAAAGRGRTHALVWLLVGALAGWSVTGGRATLRDAQRLAYALEGRDLMLTGTLAGLPQRNEAGWRFRFDVEQAQLDGAAVRVPAQLQLGWYGLVVTQDEADAARALAAELRAGDRWSFVVRLKAPHGNLNPHGFDYELWLWEQGVRATGYVRTGRHDPLPRQLAEGSAWSMARIRQNVRDAILAGAAGGDAAARRHAGIVAALVTGDQNVIERADWDVFRSTGVAHLMSISGLHITMLAWLAGALIGALWRRSARWGQAPRWQPSLWLPAPSAALVGGVLLAALYAWFSGWGVPAQRTVLMLACVAALRLAGLRWPWWQNALLAAALVLALDPWALLQAGFWLSFVAVGVLFASDDPLARRAAVTRWRPLQRLLREQVVVTVALTPLSLLLFGQASVVGLLANLIAIPWVTLLITPLALLGLLWAPAWAVAAALLAPLAWALQAMAAWPWASVSMATPPLALGAAALLGGLLLVLRLPWALRAAGTAPLLALLAWQPARPPSGQFELLAADVGQGNAVIVRTAQHTLVYDAGPRYSLESDAGHRVLAPLLRARGDRVDTLLLSHRDSDHTGGARAVLALQPQATLLSSIEDGHELQGARRATRCQAGQGWAWDGVTFELLHPLADDYAATRRSNALSCVLRVRAANGASALLVGDIEAAQEQALLARGGALQADVLLVPHHGSRTSSSGAFLDAVQPRWALIQSGYRNRFGHPADDVLARYRARGLRTIASPHCGAMHWMSAQPDRLDCERQRARRYWHHPLPP